MDMVWCVNVRIVSMLYREQLCRQVGGLAFQLEPLALHGGYRRLDRGAKTMASFVHMPPAHLNHLHNVPCPRLILRQTP